MDVARGAIILGWRPRHPVATGIGLFGKLTLDGAGRCWRFHLPELRYKVLV